MKKSNDMVDKYPFAVAGAILGTALLGLAVTFNEVSEPLADHLETLDQITAVSDERHDADACYYVDPDKAKQVVFRDWENGPFLAVMSFMLLSEGRSNPVGLIPHFETASCDIIRDDIKLTKDEATALEQKARRTIAQSARADSLSNALGQSKGTVIMRDIPRPAGHSF